MDISTPLTKSDVIAIVLGVVNTLVGIFTVAQVWRCYRRRKVPKGRKVSKRSKATNKKKTITSDLEAAGEWIEKAPLSCLEDNMTFECYSYPDDSSIKDSPPPYPLLDIPQKPPLAKLKAKL